MEQVGSGALGITLVFIGFCLAVMAIKGTYVTTWQALVLATPGTAKAGTT